MEIGNEDLLKLLNRGINVIGNDYAQNLSYRYTGGLYSYGVIDALRDHMAVFGSVILVVAALIIFLLIRDSKRTRKDAREKESARLVLEEKNRELAESKDALSDALVAAEHANRAKTTFLNNMSHDIRTPMNAIVGFTALAASHIDNPTQVKDYLGKISVSSQHLLSLINDVLDMSRIESGKVTIAEGEVINLQVSVDKLTQVNNRQNLLSYLSYKINNHEETVYLIMMDIDKFKTINDTYGHLAGDDALICVAKALKQACAQFKKRPFIARYGGDEFVVILEGTTDDLAAVEERIHAEAARFNKMYG